MLRPTAVAKEPGDSPFFERLAQWECAPRALRAFDQVINKPIATPATRLSTRLYELLVDHLLRWLELPRSDGAMDWEWEPLYRFGSQIDPYYFVEASIHRLLERWPVIGGERRQVMVSVLSGYFHLRREGFPGNYPRPLVPNQECDRWIRIFPPQWAWQALEVLHGLGLDPMGAARAYRAYARFSEGVFEPELSPDTLRRWQAECWRASGYFSAGGDAGRDDGVAPYRANFLAGAFAGGFEAMGLDAVCADVPDCGRCPLREECRWHNASPAERPGASEILALASRGAMEHLRVDQLLQGLFSMDESEGTVLRKKLASASLRRLATQSFRELKHLFGFHRLLPERLRLTFELCKRFNEERMNVGSTFRTPRDVWRHFQMRLRDLKQEQLIVVLLDSKKRYLHDVVLTQGTLDSSPVHPREVFNAAIRESAASVMIVHNHPSGDPNPSKEDIQVTRQLLKAGELVGIPVLDHIIIADDQYTSMLERGMLSF